MGFVQRQPVLWQLRTRGLQLGVRTLVVGIVNVTPDSFSGDGLGVGPCASERAVAHGLRLLDEGAGALDVGGESTRPGSGAGNERAVTAAVTATEEQDRVLPVLEGLLRERPEAVISIDTYRASTAHAAAAAGAEIVNDVSGFLWDEGMAAACAALKCGVVVMHTRGRPNEWKSLPALARDEVVPLVLAGLGERLEAALAAGIAPERVMLDPGYGFGKTWEANYALLAGQDRLLALGRPLLAGVSRKSFLGKTLGNLHGGGMAAPEQREQATIAACVGAVLNGASALRVHAVRAAVEAVAIADATLSSSA